METNPQPAVGQIWRWNFGTAGDVKLEASPSRPGQFIRVDSDGRTGGVSFTAEEILKSATFLGYGPSTPSMGSPVMEARPKRCPILGELPKGCLSCGSTLAEKGEPYECGRCNAKGYTERKEAWIAGARDFPRPSPQPVAPPHVEVTATNEQAGTLNVVRVPLYGRLVGEMRASDGTPLSALSAVACRRSSEDLKPKTPWVPSCDLDCDIPDAPGFRR